jgi:hypothetical protein
MPALANLAIGCPIHATAGNRARVDASGRIGIVKWLGVIGVATLMTGCAIGGLAGPTPPAFAGCADATRFAFVGETTLAALGLNQSDPAEGNRIGTIWVTTDKVDLQGEPVPAGMTKLPLSRAVCVQWPDGSGMSGPIDDGWQPPAGVTASQGIPAPLIALVVGVLLLGGASYLAFRRKPIPASED